MPRPIAPARAPRTDARTHLSPPWKVVVHDDPVNLMSYVTHVFMQVFAWPRAKAHMHMMEVHTQGRSIVWTGDRERAETYAVKLAAAHLRTTLERAET